VCVCVCVCVFIISVNITLIIIHKPVGVSWMKHNSWSGHAYRVMSEGPSDRLIRACVCVCVCGITLSSSRESAAKLTTTYC